VLDYLARYVFRVAITNARIIGLDDDTVTIRYQQRKSARPRTSRIAGREFLRRFLQHVLPKGFHKVRYFGLWHPTNRNLAAGARLMLGLDHPPQPPAMLSNPAPSPSSARSDQRPRPLARIAGSAISC
jgi:hypothetical protein